MAFLFINFLLKIYLLTILWSNQYIEYVAAKLPLMEDYVVAPKVSQQTRK